MTKKQTWIEIAIVLGLSLGASAVYSIISFASKLLSPEGLAGSKTNLNPVQSQNSIIDAAWQISGIIFGLAPVAIALYLLVNVSHRSLKQIGLDFRKPKVDISRAVLLAASIGIPGIGLYLLARTLGLASQVQPSSYAPSVLSVIFLALAAIRAGLLEEVIVVAYLFDRLKIAGLSRNQILLSTSLLRGTYHLYQGIGGFVGNVIMGLAFGWAYQKWGRVMPLVIAHTIMDCIIFIGYFWIPAGL